MIKRTFGLLWSLVVVAFLVYVVFFVQLGDHTLFGHIKRIAGTEEAKELGHEVKEAGQRVGDEIRKQVQEPEGKEESAPGIPEALEKLNQHVRSGLVSEEQAEKIRATLREVAERQNSLERKTEEARNH